MERETTLQRRRLVYIVLNKFNDVRPSVHTQIVPTGRPAKEEEVEILVLDLVPI